MAKDVSPRVPVEPDAIKHMVQCAFAEVPYPGDQNLVNSRLGTEPEQVAAAFRGKTDWHSLDSGVIDQAPDGLSSALSFFSDEAFQFFLPAYIVADLAGELLTADPCFHLVHGLDNSSRQTWWDHAVRRFNRFSPEQAAAVVEYLKHRRDRDGLCRHLDQALANYWTTRAAPG